MAAFASALALSLAGSIRVASLDLCADEYLLLLARPAQIASVSRVSRDPADSPLWRTARRYPANDGSIERLIGARPNLLLSSGGGAKGGARIASRLGLRTLTLPYPSSPGDVEANLRRVAAALGDPHRADAWAARLARLQRSVPAPRDTIFLDGNGSSVGAASLGAEWMRLAGFRQRALAGGRATLEQLALRPPQVLLLSDYRGAQASLGQRWLDHPLVRRAPSQRIVTDGRPWTCSGPLMLTEVERLRGLR
ncbi:MAG: ABC transporter substrate-binding protein [Sphingomicrobium sp.]